ncbi:MAG: glutamate--tRNA ligase, partial [Nitrospiraceae bacterium]
AWATPYFGRDVAMDDEAAKKFLTPVIAPLLAKLSARFEAQPRFEKELLEATFKQFVEAEGMKMGQLAQPIRVALTGRTASPGLFDVMELLGRERTLTRLKNGIARAKTSA